MKNFSLQISWVLWLTGLAFPAESNTISKPTITTTFVHNGSSLAEQIHSSTYSDITSFFRQCEGSSLPLDVVREAITLSFAGNLEHFNKVVNFINDMPCPSTKYVGLATLFDDFESNGHQRTEEMMKLIYWIKTAMSQADIDNELLLRYEKLKAKMPSDMRAILFGEYLTLKNVQENEYMYESSKWVNGHRIILTWRPGGLVSQALFYFDVHMGGSDKPYYIIRNDFYDHGSPMCQSSSYFNKERRKTVTCPNEAITASMKWFVQPLGSYFTITNWDGTQLYSPNNQNLYDKERRYVFTWQGSGQLGTQRYWIVQPY